MGKYTGLSKNSVRVMKIMEKELKKRDKDMKKYYEKQRKKNKERY